MRYGTCFLCGKTGWLEEHHVYPGPFRDKSEKYGLKVGLCGESCHRNGRYAAHQCRETSDALKQFWQIKYMMAHKASVADFRAAFGKNYLELDYYDDERSYPMNIIAISGRLTRDPELRTTPNGKPVVEFTVAVDRPGVKDQTDFIDCVAWEKKAEFVARYFKQGKRIEASGVLTTRTYEKNGVKRKRTEVRCDQVFFGESKKIAAPPRRQRRNPRTMISARCPMMMTSRSEKGEHMEENKNPLMGHVVKVPAQVSGIPDGVQMTVNAAVTTFAAVDGKPAGIESMGTAECNMLASYTRGTVSFSVHGEKPVMVSVRLDELMRLLQAAAAVCHHEQEDKKNAEEEKA